MSNLQGFQGAQPNQLPYWLGDEQGSAFQQTFGKTKDDALDLLEQATNARYPYAGRPDALPYAGKDRLIMRAPPETHAQYAARLTAAPDTWVWGGTETAIVGIFEPYGYTAATCTWIPNYDVILEGDPTWFSRGLVITAAGYWAVDDLWDAVVDNWDSDPGATWDSTATIGDLDYIRASIRTMKTDYAFPVFWGTCLTGGSGDGFWGMVPGDKYDDPGALWDVGAGEPIVFQLGYLWDDSIYYGQPGEEPAWDSPDDAWEDDPFVPPSTGWSLLP